MKCKTAIVLLALLCATSGLSDLYAQKKSKFGSFIKAVTEVATEGTKSKETVKTDAKTTESAVAVTNVVAEVVAWKPGRPVLSPSTKTVFVNSVKADCFSDGMVRVTNTDNFKFGYFDTKGNKVIDLVWGGSTNLTNQFNGGAATVMKDMKYHILHKDGSVIQMPANITRMTDFCDGIALGVKNMGVRVKGKLVYLDAQGKEIFPTLGQTIENAFFSFPQSPRKVSEGLRAFIDVNKKRWGYADKTGRIVIPATYMNADDFSDGLAAVQLYDANASGNLGKWGFIDKAGKVVVEAKFSEHPLWFANGLAPVQKQSGKFVYINKKGQVVSGEYDSANSFYAGYAFVNQVSRPKYTSVIDTTFTEVRRTSEMYIPYEQAEMGYHFQDNVASVRLGGDGCWLVSPDGKEFIKGNYNEAMFGYNSGLAHCQAFVGNQRYDGFINIKGEYIFIFKDEEF